jgi:hypothetical protein
MNPVAPVTNTRMGKSPGSMETNLRGRSILVK